MGTTPDFGIPELSQGQANPDITHNEALVMIQALLNGVKDKDLTAPPVSPTEGDAYLINTAAPTGAWTGHGKQIAVYWGATWRFVPGYDDSGTILAMGARQEGMSVYVRDEDRRYTWRGLGSPVAFAWSGTLVTAAEVSNTPAGNIAATDVQSALNELDSEKIAIAGHTANSVVGRASNSSGAAADIAAGTNDRLFAQTSNVLSFVQLTNGMVPTNTVGLDKLVNAGAQYDIVGRKTASAGAWEDCTRAQLLLVGTDLSNVMTATNQSMVFNINAQTAPPPTFNSAIQINQGDGVRIGAQFDGYAISNLWAFRRAGGTQATKTALANPDLILQWLMYGYNGSAYVQSGNMQFGAIETWSGSQNGCRWNFSATPAGATAPVVAFYAQGGVYSSAATDPGINSAYFSGTIRTGQFTVATLPAAATAGAGARAFATDTSAPAFGAVPTGGGAVGVPVYVDNAPAWRVG